MKCGSVIRVNEFEFLDGFLDREGYKRKCIVLFETEHKLCVCPIVSQVSSFNKNPNNYYFLPITNKSGKKLMFAKLNSVVYINKHDVLETIDYLGNYDIVRIINKIKANYMNCENIEYYQDAIDKIEENTPVK